ncbi:cupin domain-containing protein [Frateuria aurantia]
MKNLAMAICMMTAPLITGLALMPATAKAATGLSRTVVTTSDVGEPGYQAIIARVTLAPGATSGRHTHPGDEISYIVSGVGLLKIDGQAAQTVTAGHGIVIPTGKVHEFSNPGSKPLSLIGVYYVKKGQPLATPVH